MNLPPRFTSVFNLNLFKSINFRTSFLCLPLDVQLCEVSGVTPVLARILGGLGNYPAPLQQARMDQRVEAVPKHSERRQKALLVSHFHAHPQYIYYLKDRKNTSLMHQIG